MPVVGGTNALAVRHWLAMALFELGLSLLLAFYVAGDALCGVGCLAGVPLNGEGHCMFGGVRNSVVRADKTLTNGA